MRMQRLTARLDRAVLPMFGVRQSPRQGRQKRLRWLGLAISLTALSSHAETPFVDLASLTLEELANIQITSVSKKAERLADAAASVFVITQDDIRHSGATSLPEVLRLAPNLQVAQVSANGYTVSARGFNNSSANKLLVLIDGRSVYSPLFSGVFWDVQDLMLEDVDRIEVISGPGGTLWGTNAVNGVINVITRSAHDTQGGVAVAGAGQRESNVAARYGGSFGTAGSYRVYAKHTERAHTETANGTVADDASHMTQAGLRMDWRRASDQLSVQANVYSGEQGQPAPGAIVTGKKFALGAISLSGTNLLTHWERQTDSGSRLSLQAYYDHTERVVPPTFSDKLDIVDIQLQYTLPRAGMHELVWGAQYRYGMDHVVNSQYFAFLPADLKQKWSSLFAQDEMRLREDLRLTAGARVERNDYTGTEFLPSLRLAWQLSPHHSLWSAVSRTVRAPSRLDRDAYVPGTAPFLLIGGPAFRSEVANVLEIGYRGQISSRLSYSATAYHARYDDLHTQESAPGGRPVFFANGMEGRTSGIEMWGTFQVTQYWRLSGGYTAERERLRLKANSHDLASLGSAGKDPAYQWQLRSMLELSPVSELDLMLRRVAALSNPAVPAYTSVDVRYAWRPQQNLELSVTGQNLAGNGHGEFTGIATRSDFGRSVFFKVLSRF